MFVRRIVSYALFAMIGASLVMCTTTAPPPSPLTDQTEMTSRIVTLMPSSVHHRAQWASAIITALSAQHIKATADNVCAVVALIEVGSNYQPNPRLHAPDRLVHLELTRQAHAHHIPAMILARALRVTSPDGRSYADRQASIQTEFDLYTFFQDMIQQLSAGKHGRRIQNPVSRAGSMQVPILFALHHPPFVDQQPTNDASALFSLRPGIAAGVAYLFDHPEDQRTLEERLADYFLAPYASRNAALQAALAKITGEAIQLDGNLTDQSPTARWIKRYSDPLGLSVDDITHGLEHGQDGQLKQTRLFQRIMALAQQQTGSVLPSFVIAATTLKPLTNGEKVASQPIVNRLQQRWRTCVATMPPLLEPDKALMPAPPHKPDFIMAIPLGPRQLIHPEKIGGCFEQARSACDGRACRHAQS